MKERPHWFLLALYGFGAWVFESLAPISAAVVNVSVDDFDFSPSSPTININDQVKWTWVGIYSHSSTSTLWSSGIHGSGFTFTHTFPSAGSFPYYCSLHS